MTVDQWNDSRYPRVKTGGNGIECPECGSEMVDSDPGVIMTSAPAQKRVHCPQCKCSTTVLA